MNPEVTISVLKPAELISAIWTFNPSEKKLKELLGTGFLINEEQVAITAKHIFNDYDESKMPLKAVLINRDDKVFVLDACIINKSKDYDIAAIKISGIKEASFFEVKDKPLLNNADYLTVEYSQSSIELNQSTERETITFRPSTRKGNIVKVYESEWPETKPTKTIEISFPVLQGASGAPLIENSPPWNVVGMITHNIQYDLMPAQTVKIRDGKEYYEEIKYFLPVGKAIRAEHLLEFIEEITD